MIPTISLIKKTDLARLPDPCKPKVIMNETEVRVLFKMLQDALFDLRNHRSALNSGNGNREEWLITLDLK